MLDLELIRSTLPLTAEEIASSSWSGVTHPTAKAAFAVADIFASAAHPGFFHCRVIGKLSVSETKRPVSAEVVSLQMDSLLSEHKCAVGDLLWRKSETPAGDPGASSRLPTGSQDVVYFLKAGPFIKIGKATYSPALRVRELQTGCPYPIEVLNFVPGDIAMERKFHKRFAHCRAHGEWFHASASLLSFIDALEG